jgi:hypothetical protein
VSFEFCTRQGGYSFIVVLPAGHTDWVVIATALKLSPGHEVRRDLFSENGSVSRL